MSITPFYFSNVCNNYYSQNVPEKLKGWESIPCIPTHFDSKSTITSEENKSFNWNSFTQANKISAIKEIFSNPVEGDLHIQNETKKINLHYKYKDSGTQSRVYIMSFENMSFALKILFSGSKLGESAQELINHSIDGVVKLHSAEIFDIDGAEVVVCAMDHLEKTWVNWMDSNSKSSDFLFVLSRMKNLTEALIGLEKKGFLHANIGQCNVMFDKNDDVYLIDVDSMPRVTDPYADFKRKNEVEALHNFANHLFYKFRKDSDVKKFYKNGSLIPNPEIYLKKLTKLIEKIKLKTTKIVD